MRKPVDLRSDTFSLPDEGMRRAIYEAEVGNSGYGEDPSVSRLEERCASYFGQEAAVFLPSGTMAGQIAIRTRTRQGDLVLIEEFGHDYYFETGSMSAISGVQAFPLRARRGILDPGDIEASLRHPENGSARVALLVIENSSNFGGGTIYPAATLERIFAVAGKAGLPVHVDGARIWNAIAATDQAPSSLIAPGGSLSACLSKGLGAPMGSVLVGPSAFIEEARRIQMLLGGVMRQVGFMAAAGLYALDHNLARLGEDHANCRAMAEILSDCPGIEIEPGSPETNILYLRVQEGPVEAEAVLRQMREENQGDRAWGGTV